MNGLQPCYLCEKEFDKDELIPRPVKIIVDGKIVKEDFGYFCEKCQSWIKERS